jgi:hypothetical protein
VSDRLDATAKLFDEIAEQLDLATQHCRVAAQHFRNALVPRGAAHAWAAYGHVLEAQQRLHAQAREHAAVSAPDPT